MLSKAEVLFLQGNKKVSKSYERKLRCIIRKKLDILLKEFPLLSKLFVDEVQTLLSSQIDESISNKEGDETVHRSGQKLAIDNSATVFGNSISTHQDQARSTKIADRESIEGSKASNPASTVATEFSNGM